jgi:hypothetical protein
MAAEYWSSTTRAYHPDDAWVAFFYKGDVSTNLKSTSYYVRAVSGS